MIDALDGTYFMVCAFAISHLSEELNGFAYWVGEDDASGGWGGDGTHVIHGTGWVCQCQGSSDLSTCSPVALGEFLTIV
jgi:hypothetical protein